MWKPNSQKCRWYEQWAMASLLALWAVCPGWGYALPTKGEIVFGNGSIQQPTAQDLVIRQDSQQLITNWQGFSIGSAESVTFQQPGVNSVALNRVIGADPSLILGKLSANGQVFLSNPSGVIFGNGAVVDLHGLLATTLNISNQDFLNGNYQFNQDPGRSLAAVVNNGTLNATRYIGLLAPAVENNGSIIVADLGSVALASGTAATLDFNGDGLISFAVTGEVSGVVIDPDGNGLKVRIHNSGHIRANGGQVLLTARSAGDVIGNVVNHSGIIEAQTVQQKDGKIILFGGDQGTVEVSGTLDASGVFITAGAVTVAAGKFLSTNNGDINIVANYLDLKGDLDSGTGDVLFTLADGGDLNLEPGNSNGNLSGNDLGHITAENLILKTDGDINVKGITEKNTDGIAGSVILESGGNITFEGVASTFPALNFSAVNDINVNADVTTTQGDFIAVADSENNGVGDFNVAPGAVITSARDIDVTAPNINFDGNSFNETRNLILNGNVVGDEPEPEPSPVLDADSIQQGSLGTFLTDFLKNGGPSC